MSPISLARMLCRILITTTRSRKEWAAWPTSLPRWPSCRTWVSWNSAWCTFATLTILNGS
eukprot:7257869-Pyramimonas_sp.AAC.1